MQLLAESLATLDSSSGRGAGWRASPTGALALLRGTAAATLEGPFGQAHELRQPTCSSTAASASSNATCAATGCTCAHAPPFKSYRLMTRYLADNGGAFVDVIIRSLFGYAPAWSATSPAALLDELTMGEPRGVAAELRYVRTPFGVANLSIGTSGTRIALARPQLARVLRSAASTRQACEHPRVDCVEI